MKNLCGIDCSEWKREALCGGCAETGGHPFGGDCLAAECDKTGGELCCIAYKNKLMEEFNALAIADMPPITDLCPLNGSYINLEYPLPNGEKVKLLDDTKVYLGYQVEKPDSDRCYGLAADSRYLLVCEYGCHGADPEIVVYKRRESPFFQKQP